MAPNHPVFFLPLLLLLGSLVRVSKERECVFLSRWAVVNLFGTFSTATAAGKSFFLLVVAGWLIGGCLFGNRVAGVK